MTPKDLRNIHTTQIVTTPQQSATKEHLFLYLQGDKSGLTKPKKDKHQHLSQLPPTFISLSQFQLI